MIKFDFKHYKRIYTADFETSTEKWGLEVARIWAWDICTPSLKHYTGNSIETFFDFAKDKGGLYCFHNLAYDGIYILDYIMKKGYLYSDSKILSKNTFRTVISDMGQHYAYEINYDGTIIYFMDSFKFIHMSVEKVAECYSLPISKLKINYDEIREEGHILTEEEENYIHNDTEIMMRAIQIKLQDGETKFTQSGNARYEFRKTFSRGEYEALFPKLDINHDKYIRKSYVGGYTYLEENRANKDLYCLSSWDCNSMYPDKNLHYLMPYGYPEFNNGKYKEDSQYPLFVQHIKVCCYLKENKTPSIPKKRVISKSSSEYMKTTDFRMVELWLTSPDMDLLFDNYEIIDIEYIDYCCFKAVKGYEVTPKEATEMTVDEIIELDGKGSLFYNYFKPWRLIKEHSKGAKRTNAKLMQNALYGVFGTNPLKKSAIPCLKDNKVSFTISNEKEVNAMYIPIATFTTAYSRKMLIDLINLNKDRFVYCDTDSLYVMGEEPPKGIKVHDTLYGYFKNEHIIEKARFIGAKRYIYYGKEPKSDKYEWIIGCCGAPNEVKDKMNWENFVEGNVFDGKLMSKTIKGGKILCNTTYALKR